MRCVGALIKNEIYMLRSVRVGFGANALAYFCRLLAQVMGNGYVPHVCAKSNPDDGNEHENVVIDTSELVNLSVMEECYCFVHDIPQLRMLSSHPT